MFNRFKILRYFRCHTLQILPFHLQRFCKSSICSLWISACNFREFGDSIDPMINFGSQPFFSCCITANKSPKVAVTITVLKVKFSKLHLSLVAPGRSADENAFGWLRKISSGRAAFQKQSHGLGNAVDGTSNCHVVSVPRLESGWHSISKVFGQGSESKTIENH